MRAWSRDKAWRLTAWLKSITWIPRSGDNVQWMGLTSLCMTPRAWMVAYAVRIACLKESAHMLRHRPGAAHNLLLLHIQRGDVHGLASVLLEQRPVLHALDIHAGPHA